MRADSRLRQRSTDHAQREACDAFVRSQQQEGWRVLATLYDDGGISGSTLERPALQQLLRDSLLRERPPGP